MLRVYQKRVSACDHYKAVIGAKLIQTSADVGVSTNSKSNNAHQQDQSTDTTSA